MRRKSPPRSSSLCSAWKSSRRRRPPRRLALAAPARRAGRGRRPFPRLPASHGDRAPSSAGLPGVRRRDARRPRHFPITDAASEACQSRFRLHAPQLVDHGVRPHCSAENRCALTKYLPHAQDRFYLNILFIRNDGSDEINAAGALLEHFRRLTVDGHATQNVFGARRRRVPAPLVETIRRTDCERALACV